MGRFGPTRRKIPTPKRHGVRDPLKRLAEREASIKDKINNPPKEYDVQEVSNRVKRFMTLTKEINQPRQQRFKQKKEKPKLQIGNTVVQKRNKESEESFLLRASEVQHDREVEADFGAKFGVEVEHDDQTGVIRVIKRKGIEVDGMLQEISDKKTGRPNKRKVKSVDSAKEKKALIAEKKQKKIEKQREEEDLLLREYQLERVPFGEVVKEPPTLHTLPRRAVREGVPRPGTKGLLLASLLEPTQTEEQQEPSPKKTSKKKAAETKLDLKGKRKKLPVATRMKIEREQQSVIEMYRQLKKKPSNK
uniref:Coiled-coil domain-containing protein 137 n=1 Tax=Anopheles culicifacies TaxID=139723 RepID=A0A182MWQ2_9DIPT